MAPPNAARPAPDLPGNGPRGIDSLAANDTSDHSEIAGNSQAQNEHRSAAVAAAIERNHKRLLAIKRGSIESLAGMAGASLDRTMEALENVDDDELLVCGAQLIENVRGFARLLADFRDERGARQ
jgi:hypothetical protein